jgi:uncharacterized protein YkwD
MGLGQEGGCGHHFGTQDGHNPFAGMWHHSGADNASAGGDGSVESTPTADPGGDVTASSFTPITAAPDPGEDGTASTFTPIETPSAAPVPPTPSAQPSGVADTGSVTNSTSNSTSIQQMLADLNASRASEGKPPLALDPQLSKLAQAHSDDMQAQNSMFHNSLGDVLATGATAAAQNVTGAGFSADGANAAFYNEKNNPGGEQGHYQNMMGDYTKVGIGVSADGRWTLDFAN